MYIRSFLLFWVNYCISDTLWYSPFFPSVFIKTCLQMPLENYICIHKTSFSICFPRSKFIDNFFSLILAYIVHPIKNRRKEVLILPFPIEDHFVSTPQRRSSAILKLWIIRPCQCNLYKGRYQNRLCGVNMIWQGEGQSQFRLNTYPLLDQKLIYQTLWRKHLILPFERIEIENGFFPSFELSPTRRTYLFFGCHLRNQTIQNLLV